MIEQLQEEHVRTARAKGMRKSYVFFRYAWRGSLIPIVTILGMDLSALLSGAVVTEFTFDLAGIGRLAVDSSLTKDLPVTMGVMLFGAFFDPAPEHPRRPRLRVHRPARTAQLGETP
ncbi:hypothetical protein SALBM217S_03591 [Streptomyces griseoloalbus]